MISYYLRFMTYLVRLATFGRKNLRYQKHIDNLANELKCELRQANGLRACKYDKGVQGPLINNQKDYLTLLHELGHFYHSHTYRTNVLEEEAQAWEWAIEQCQDEIDYQSRKFILHDCLGSYYRVRSAWEPTTDYFWSVVVRINNERSEKTIKGTQTPD